MSLCLVTITDILVTVSNIIHDIYETNREIFLSFKDNMRPHDLECDIETPRETYIYNLKFPIEHIGTFWTPKRTVSHRVIKAMYPELFCCAFRASNSNIWSKSNSVVNVNSRLTCLLKHCLHSHVTNGRDMI